MKKLIIATALVFMLGMVPGGEAINCEDCGPSPFVSSAQAAPSAKLRQRFASNSKKQSGKWYSKKNLKKRFLKPQWTYRYANKWGFYDTTPVPFSGIYERQYRKYYINR